VVVVVAEGRIELHDTPLTHSHGPYSITVADLAVGRAGLEPPYRRDFHGAPPINLRRKKKKMRRGRGGRRGNNLSYWSFLRSPLLGRDG